MSGLSKPSPRLAAGLSLLGAFGLFAGSAQDTSSLEIYGFVMADFIQDFNRVDPDWESSLRPSKIPTAEGQFGSDGQSIFSVKQTRFGVRGSHPVGGQDLKFRFEFDLYGTGDDAGQTTMRPRHFYGEWGPVLAGQTNTLFMDGDTFPNTIEYWGPNGMAFVRNVQVRFTHTNGGHVFAVALEKPSNDIDPGNIRVIAPELNLQGDEKLPDLTAAYRYNGSWGHVQAAGLLRQISFESIGTPDNEPKGDDMGWGINLTSNIKVGAKDVIHLGVVFGEGFATYMNDGGVDLAPTALLSASPPIFPPPPGSYQPDAVPLLGLLIYYDHYWNDQWATSIGWSQLDIDNTNFQSPDAMRNGQYATVNLLWTPDPRMLFGGELQWGTREDKNGASGEDVRIQFSAKYSFSSNDFR